MRDEDDRASQGSRTGRRSRRLEDSGPDDVLARLGIRAPAEPAPEPWLEREDEPRPVSPTRAAERSAPVAPTAPRPAGAPRGPAGPRQGPNGIPPRPPGPHRPGPNGLRQTVQVPQRPRQPQPQQLQARSTQTQTPPTQTPQAQTPQAEATQALTPQAPARQAQPPRAQTPQAQPPQTQQAQTQPAQPVQRPRPQQARPPQRGPQPPRPAAPQPGAPPQSLAAQQPPAAQIRPPAAIADSAPSAPSTAPSGPDRRSTAPRGEDTALVDKIVDEEQDRVDRIDASLIRLTAIHRGEDLPDEDAEDGGPEHRVTRGSRALEAPPAPPLSRRGLIGRIVAAAAALLTFAGLALGWGATRWMDSTIRTVAALDPGTGVLDAAAQQGDENVLILGTASGSSGETTTAARRSDTLMLAHLPADGGKAAGVSFPLDLEINRPPCPRWDAAAAAYVGGTVPAETRIPLSSAYAVGGPRCLVRTIQQLSGMPVTRFVALDLPGIKDMVDALGGVNVCVTRPVVDAVLGPVVPQAGTSRLGGDQAVRFAEAGQVQGDPSASYGQAQRQQQLLAATFGQALSASTLLNPVSTRDFAAALSRSMLADDVDVNDLLRVTGSLDRLDGPQAAFVPVPVSAVPNTRGNRELRDTEAGRLFGALRKHQALPEATTPVASTAGPKPGDVTVGIQNASDRAGLAGQVSGSLRSLGFGIGEVGNAAAPSPDTVLRFSPDRADAAQLLGTVVPGATLVQDPGSTGTLQLVLGRGFDGTVRAPVEQAPATTAQEPAATCT
ncbi:hypothetical protein GCM10009836_17870 [Pseudonocardia ailaonensis]|uniref:LytR family transcriptional regulator n=1 Tax=Pseudonocardia ailaonensis TaxID=367279 RepID=A0ABN2MVY8_9PSEU